MYYIEMSNHGIRKSLKAWFYGDQAMLLHRVLRGWLVDKRLHGLLSDYVSLTICCDIFGGSEISFFVFNIYMYESGKKYIY